MATRLRQLLQIFAAMFALLPISAIAADTDSFSRGVVAYDAGDYAQAYEIWLPLAEAGDFAAQQNVAQLLRQGLGIERDVDQAFRLHTQAATAGLVSAQINLADLYASGTGTVQNYDKAAHWYARAAASGHPNGQYQLANLIEKGLRPSRDPDLAAKLYRAAALQGHSQAAERLRELTARQSPLEGSDSAGGTATTDETTAIRVQKSVPSPTLAGECARDDLERAFARACTLFGNGRRGEALELWKRLAKQGNSNAMVAAGYAHLLGLGTAKDPELALFYFQNAERAHHPGALEMVNEALIEAVRRASDRPNSG